MSLNLGNKFESAPIPGSPVPSSIASNSGPSQNDVSQAFLMLNNRIQQLELQLQSQNSGTISNSGSVGSPKVSLPDKFSGTVGKHV